MYLAATQNGKFLYVANAEMDSSNVSAYRINSKTGALSPTNPATFLTPVHSPLATGLATEPRGIVIDPSDKFVYSALDTANRIGGLK